MKFRIDSVSIRIDFSNFFQHSTGSYVSQWLLMPSPQQIFVPLYESGRYTKLCKNVLNVSQWILPLQF